MRLKNLILSFIAVLAISSCNINNPNTSSGIGTSTPSSQTSENSSTINNSSISSVVEKKWEDGRVLLDCGYYQMDIPKNHNNPYKLETTLSQDESTWSNNDMKEYLPSGFRYIYKNACDDGPVYHKTSAKFYSSNNKAPGGLKIDNIGVGFQSQMFIHNGEKLEIRIGISQVNNSSDKPEEGKDTFHIYFFDKNGNYLDKHIVQEKTLTVNTKEIHFYWTKNAKDIAYFEFRCNAMPYKGQQCYNVGIAYCNFKSWERI